MPGVISAAAKRYVEFDGAVGERKRRRTSPLSVDGDFREQNDARAVSFEVSYVIFAHATIGS